MEAADPRPTVTGSRLAGARCARCGHGFFPVVDCCPACLGAAQPVLLGPSGVVWSSTVVHVTVGDRQPPWALAYVDLDDGPRVLGRLDLPVVIAPGTHVELAGDDGGDPVFQQVKGNS